jgi:hypothetical protein
MKLRGIEEQSDRLVESLRNGGKHAVQGMITYKDIGTLKHLLS